MKRIFFFLRLKQLRRSWEAFLTDSIFKTIFKLNRAWRMASKNILFVCLKIESVKQVYKDNNVVYSSLDVSVRAVQKTFMFLDIYDDIFQKCNLWTPTWQKPTTRAAVRCARSLIMHISTCVSLTVSQTDKHNWSTFISSSSPRLKRHFRWWRRAARETSGALLEEVLLI